MQNLYGEFRLQMSRDGKQSKEAFKLISTSFPRHAKKAVFFLFLIVLFLSTPRADLLTGGGYPSPAFSQRAVSGCWNAAC